MPPTARIISGLSPDTRRELDRRIRSGEYSTAKQFWAALSAMGLSISRSAAYEYFKNLNSVLGLAEKIRQRPALETYTAPRLAQERGELETLKDAVQERIDALKAEVERRRKDAPERPGEAGG